MQALGSRRQLDGDDVLSPCRLGELFDRGYPLLLTETQTHHALGAFGAIGLGAPMGEITDDGGVCDEFAAHPRSFSVVEDVGVGAVAEVVLPRRTREGVELIV